jgi:hypothetical protein
MEVPGDEPRTFVLYRLGRRELHVVSEIVSLAIGVNAGLLFRFGFSAYLTNLSARACSMLSLLHETCSFPSND